MQANCFDKSIMSKDYSLKDIRQVLEKFLSLNFKTKDDKEIRGDEVIIAKLYEIIANADNKNSQYAISAIKQLTEIIRTYKNDNDDINYFQGITIK